VRLGSIHCSTYSFYFLVCLLPLLNLTSIARYTTCFDNYHVGSIAVPKSVLGVLCVWVLGGGGGSLLRIPLPSSQLLAHQKTGEEMNRHRGFSLVLATKKNVERMFECLWQYFLNDRNIINISHIRCNNLLKN
jgi:hypothetical protein